MTSNSPVTKATILISGNGSNLQALIDSTSNLLPNLKIVRVISNKAAAYGLKRAAAASIPTTYHNLIAGKYYKSGEPDAAVKQQGREKYDEDLANLILADKPDLVICAGWMHILTPRFLDPLEEARIPVINLHPALPGKYDGAAAIERAFADFEAGKLEDDTTGIMIHYVISAVDRGEPIVVRNIECRKGESLGELQERIHGEEHTLIIEGTQMAISRLWSERGKST
ncbi:Formyltransferase [Glarea lozoyensis ATCC 20868]|uniref:Phosphoribosylglycinamide formyltransferase n=2 Tax=Glarea lozoyensis TaxID=101852 RepID=S3CZX2_GLAL2|nr:Formyltransferase [Glarea lozoyensis ATCC 20868]EHK96782.1 putative Phosphoribosylglycinamide formyltransferase [Glarea lozoyensis 74030]EPE31797.1 Formyltransferase [Glarea lozoyensis ATCC 20868]